ADLAVLDPARGAGVLPLYPGRLGALLEEAGLVNDQHPVGVAEVGQDVLAQVVADRVGVPVGTAEQVLDAVGGGVAETLGPLPGVLALDVQEQAVDVLQDAAARLGAREVAGDALAHASQLVAPALDILDG